MYEGSCVNGRFEPCSTLTFTCKLSYIAPILFLHEKKCGCKNYATVLKNPPLSNKFPIDSL